MLATGAPHPNTEHGAALPYEVGKHIREHRRELPQQPAGRWLVGDGLSDLRGVHEYAETITDQFPTGGWTANNGEEVGDLCAWKTTGTARVQDITLTTCTFAVQGIWSNIAGKTGACSIKHSVIT